MYVDLNTEKAATLAELRRRNPRVSLSDNPDDASLQLINAARLQLVQRPVGDVVTPGDPELRDDGKWYQTWEVRAYTEEEREGMLPGYPQFTALEMLDLFTESEQLAVVTATMQVPAVKLWYDRLIAATFVTYEDPRTEGGL